MDESRRLPAGDFSAWSVEMKGALRGERDSNVACGGCTACCTSSQFVHIGPDEKGALAHIPKALLFPAPGLPRGHVLLGYDERGHCPMLKGERCSIYEHRPRTCRTYDCRIFPATGLVVDGDKVSISAQAERWEFTFPTAADRSEHDAVRAAAAFLGDHAEALPTGSVPTNTTQRAVLALELDELFLRRDPETGSVAAIIPDLDVVRAELLRRTKTLLGQVVALRSTRPCRDALVEQVCEAQKDVDGGECILGTDPAE